MGEITTYETENPGNIRERLLMYSEHVKKLKKKKDEDEKKSKEKED